MEDMRSVSLVVALLWSFTDGLDTTHSLYPIAVWCSGGAPETRRAMLSPPAQWQGLTRRGPDGDDPGARASVPSITHYVTPTVPVLCVCRPGLVCPTDSRAGLLKQGLAMAAVIDTYKTSSCMIEPSYGISLQRQKHSRGLQVHKYIM